MILQSNDISGQSYKHLTTATDLTFYWLEIYLEYNSS